MWAVQDQSVFKRVADAMYDRSIFIADGHHRYETSRNYRNIMRARYGWRSPNRAYEYVMMYLTNMEDEGLTILPSHRLIKRCDPFQLDPFLARLKAWFEITHLPFSTSNHPGQCLNLKQMLEAKGRHRSVIGFHHHKDDKFYFLCLKPGLRDEMDDDLQPPLKKLDVLVLSRLILQKGLGFSKEDLDNEEIFHYHSDMTKTLSLVDSGNYQMAFLVNPTKIEQVKEVASNFLIMPRKSTYFYPKVLSGLVINKIDPYETVQVL
jgi:uncharacterized protein (DUF1015 family)